VIPLDSLLLLAAVAGYGDPVDGFPSAEERALVLWTNAARVAPEAFTNDYREGGCSLRDFSMGEKEAQAPLYIDLALTEAARYHSEDMRDNGCFQHESCDGTDTWERVDRFYKDSNSGVGENIAYGSSDPRYTVMAMWMCSTSGHRANIMSGDYNEMGGGVADTFMTQDFAAGELKEGSPPVRVAAEYGDAVYADWGDADAPSRLDLVVDDVASELVIFEGAPEQGVYYGAVDDVPECTPWRVEWETAAGEEGAFPATGGFLMGNCEKEYEADAGFAPIGDGAGDDSVGPTLVLCGTDAPAGWALLIFSGLLTTRRRR
jgi:hypothetical protein